MKFLLVLAFVATSATAQQLSAQALPCGFSCTRRAVITSFIDGQPGTASCSENTNAGRCEGCCKGRALQDRLATTSATGFISNDGRTCVCCFNKSNCGATAFGNGK
ncbi:unnamed protein product [Caenorhabditis angaria]|uniref:Uncharacterized protein n=1 Tax=Caenorhabditis angaria TaxID=860376 RepID=A0A9P1J065_9PELO|nr:unnamed protein product [Caenorhabditis angaria]